ncbi:MAG: hypothetical protein ACRCWW_00620 [Scandinavium sp.]|uniref:hypothetical protein n=1 Tax=Scandinavium sp. TaxID=2830653 RepID=UPI003F41010D
MATLGIITNDAYSCEIFEDDDGRVYFKAGAAIDADGANGQNQKPAAYKSDDSGTEYLANGGMKIVAGKVVCAHEWARSIVVLDSNNEPKIFPGGIIASTTWYRIPGLASDVPEAYVDSECVPYVVVPSLIVQKTKGVVRGCKARVTWNGNSVDCVVADLGPKSKIGEISIEAARQLGIPESPKNGGIKAAEVFYEIWPGIVAPGFVLQPA